ncbi:MAG: 1,4-dihydroxy-2-naphthoyl-CoA hydrolase in menaquinone biosynthesis, partial [uncultured Nocardioides sp.]
GRHDRPARPAVRRDPRGLPRPDAPRHGHPEREDGHRDPRARRRARGGDHAGRGQPAAVRPAARRRVRRARRDAGLDRLRHPRLAREAVRRRRHQRHAPPRGHVGDRHRGGHRRAPGPQHRVVRGRHHRRARQAGLHLAAHLRPGADRPRRAV